jgi:small-conductance mechanosensitive channel
MTALDQLSYWVRGDGLEIVLFVLGAILLGRFVGWLRDRITGHIDAANDEGGLVRSEASKFRHSLAQALTWLATVVIWAVTAALVLNRLGVPLASLVAPVTVIGAALGFGAQQLIRDLLGGMFIIAERQYGYGDLVRIAATPSTDGTTGVVEDVTLRVTRLRTANGEAVVIPNGQVFQVTNLSSQWARAVVDVPLPLDADVVRANEVLRDVGDDAYEDDELKRLLLDRPTVMGVESFADDKVHLRLVARTLPGRQLQVERALRARVVVAFQRTGVARPREAVREGER